MRVPGLHVRDIGDMGLRMRWVRRVEQRISLGYEAPRPLRKISPQLLAEVLRHGAQALGIRAELCERQSIPVSADFDEKLIDRAVAKAPGQLGSVGGGNHFVELQADRDSGEVWLMVHCGSRGFGWQAADYFFRRGAELNGLPMNRREESWLRVPAGCAGTS
jgi:tRNA-splicing ligase RtcB